MYASLLAVILFLTTSSSYQPKLVVPSFRSLTIHTRITTGDWSTTEQTLYLQGARQRTDTAFTVSRPGEASLSNRSALIVQCDSRRQIVLDLTHRTYDEGPFLDWSERAQKAQAAIQPIAPAGGDVTVTIDSVDTGERRQFGSLTARHVRVRTTIDSGPGAHTSPGTEERDGWYVDLPGLSCQEMNTAVTGWLQASPGRDNMHFRRLGKATTGYPVEQVTRNLQGGQTLITKTELVKLCEKPIDDALFERPSDFQPALHSVLGTDFSRPDNWTNRIQAYLDYLRLKTASWFR